MVTKSKKTSAGKKGRVRVGKLKVNKETVRDLLGNEKMQIKGGLIRDRSYPVVCCPSRNLLEVTCAVP